MPILKSSPRGRVRIKVSGSLGDRDTRVESSNE